MNQLHIIVVLNVFAISVFVKVHQYEKQISYICYSLRTRQRIPYKNLLSMIEFILFFIVFLHILTYSSNYYSTIMFALNICSILCCTLSLNVTVQCDTLKSLNLPKTCKKFFCS